MAFNRIPFRSCSLSCSLSFIAALVFSYPAHSSPPPIATKMADEMMMRQQFSGSMIVGRGNIEYLPHVHASIEVFGKSGFVSGFGEVVVRLNSGMLDVKDYSEVPETLHPRSKKITPEFSYVELAGRRFFPGETDSIKVWDLTGMPVDSSHWVFLLAHGKVNAYSHYPSPVAQYFALGANTADRILPDSAACFGKDSLQRLLTSVPRARLEFETDPVYAAMIFNSASEREHRYGSYDEWYPYQRLREWNTAALKAFKNTGSENEAYDYPYQLIRAWSLCEKKTFSEAEIVLGQVSKSVPNYYRLFWAQGYCSESAGNPGQALKKYREALRWAPVNRKLAASLSQRILAMEKAAPDTAAYRSATKLARPKGQDPFDGGHGQYR